MICLMCRGEPGQTSVLISHSIGLRVLVIPGGVLSNYWSRTNTLQPFSLLARGQKLRKWEMTRQAWADSPVNEMYTAYI
jgi:hypothetical protein